MRHRLRPPYRSHLTGLPLWRHAFLLFIGAAFFLQSYVTQTHIHAHGHPAAHGLAALDTDGPANADKAHHGAPSHDRLPADDDPAKCPLCQAVAHAGSFVWPHAAAALLVPQLSAAIVPVVAAVLRFPEPRSHAWQGRAPPRL